MCVDQNSFIEHLSSYPLKLIFNIWYKFSLVFADFD